MDASSLVPAPSPSDDERRLARLRWRARRGLLENDLLIERFLSRRGSALSPAQVEGFEELLQLSDPDLLELLLGRRHAESTELSTAAREVLAQLRMS
jgi:antitoxin CptB